MLASCPLGMLEEPYLGASAVEIKRELPATGIETVTDLALTYNVPAPVYGGTPVTSFAGPQYVGAVTWAKSADGTPPGGLFEANTAYTATVTLLATAGRTFTGVGENSFTHGAAGAVVTNGANSTVVTIAFPATTAVMAATVRDLDLSSKVPSPVMGGTPVTSFVGPQYMGAVAWMETGAGTAHSGLFAAATGYTAVVTLTAMSGWNFSAPEFTHSGAESAPVSAPSGGSYIATIAFPATGGMAAAVTDLALTYNVPAPVYGGTPVTSFAGPQYIGTAAWAETNTGNGIGGLFEAGTAYTATVTLTAAAGRTFIGVGANSFAHGAAGTFVTNGVNSNVVTIAFPATTAEMAAAVTELDLSAKVPAPVMGGTPAVSVVGPQYTGAVAWKETGAGTAQSGLFMAGTAYTATVTLTAVSGWTFSDPVFTHTGAETAPVSAFSGGRYTVTISFPATVVVTVPTVDDLDLTYTVPVPVKGGTPVMFVSGPQYTGTVNWAVTGGAAHSGLFGSGAEYTATVNLTAAGGYTFSGVGANAFTHGGRKPGVTPNPANTALNPGLVTIRFPATTDVMAVTDFALNAKVPAPVKGGTPVMYVSGTQYTGIVNWTAAANPLTPYTIPFASASAYTATVTLAAAAGYTFSGVGADAFYHGTPGTSVTNAENLSPPRVTISFPPTAGDDIVDDLWLTYNVPAPVKGGTPVGSFAGPQYTGRVDWADAGGNSLTDTFASGEKYTATVTLEAKPGYTFNGVAANAFNHAGKDTAEGAKPNPVNAVNLSPATVTIKFPVTEDRTLQTVTDLALTYNVPAPVPGATPVSSFTGWQYYGAVDWFKSGDTTPYLGLFEAHTWYKAKVTMLPVAGYTFQGVGEDAFAHARAPGAKLYNAPDSGVVEIIFPTTVTDLDLSGRITPAAAGVAPVTTPIDAAQYTGTVEWFEADGTSFNGNFEAGKKYKAVADLTPKPGWVFTGVAANAFTHAGKDTSVTPNPANAANLVPPKVSIVFPTAAFAHFSGASGPADGSAIDGIQAAKTAGKASVTIPLAAGTEPARLEADTDLGTAGFTLTTGNSPANVTIDGGGRVVDLTGSAPGALITVGSGVTLTLTNITFKGLKAGDGADTADNTAPVIKVNGGTLVLGAGTLIKDNVSSGNGGGVQVASGTFKVEGGEISGNTAANGGGVYGTVTVNSGEISGNTAVSGGGVYGTATVNSGKISGNSAANGGGVYGTAAMSSGEISGNTVTGKGGGVYVTGSVSMSGDAVISGNTALHGGGAYVPEIWRTVSMSGSAAIKNNKATGNGGGVCLPERNGTLNMGTGTSISGNEAVTGGGVYLSSVFMTLTLAQGAVISGNKAANGGGLWLGFMGDSWKDVAFTLNNGEISGNTATADGGGIYVGRGYPTITGGIIIRGNTAGGNGGGLYAGAPPNWGTGPTMKGGTIEGNSATSGGGVYVAAGAFTKKDADDGDSGTIYGDTNTTHAPGGTENTAMGGSGHAAYVVSGPKKRDATADTDDNLDSAIAGTDGGWDP